MKKAKTWDLEGYGGSFYGDDIKNLIAGFAVYNDEDFTYEQARDLIVEGVEKFLSEINCNQSLKKYLNHYPFTFEDIEYRIVFNTAAHEELSYISLVKGFLVYRLFDEAQIDSTLLFEEPYIDALAKVRSHEQKNIAKAAQTAASANTPR